MQRDEWEERMRAGRGGSCELMIGCIAKADKEELHVDMSEMEVAAPVKFGPPPESVEWSYIDVGPILCVAWAMQEVRWIPREQIRLAVQRSSAADMNSGGGCRAC